MTLTFYELFSNNRSTIAIDDRVNRNVNPIVFTMISSGIRLGVWDYLRRGHIEPIYENVELLAPRLREYADED